MTSSASVDRQDAMTQHSNNSNVGASNNTQYPHVPDQENCVHDHEISLEHSLQNLEVTTEDVLNTLNDMKSNKSQGPDNTYPIILKETKDEISGALASFFNMSLRQGLFPADWETGNVTPSFKKGDRPISLTSVVGKMLESIVRDKIVRYLESHSLIRDSQHSFRYERSCLSNLLTFYNDLFSGHDITRSLDIVHLDFQKAFD